MVDDDSVVVNGLDNESTCGSKQLKYKFEDADTPSYTNHNRDHNSYLLVRT